LIVCRQRHPLLDRVGLRATLAPQRAAQDADGVLFVHLGHCDAATALGAGGLLDKAPFHGGFLGYRKTALW
jgi:hypothetical protein